MSSDGTNGSTPNAGNNSERLTGRVKWFNNRAGFGFVTVLDGEKKDEDVFVHHSGIEVSSEQYKYLVQGEYVNFDFSKIENSDKDREWQAVNVTGVCGGKLMCETRNDNKQYSSKHNADKGDKQNNSEKSSVQFEGK